jgi:hypothetical protein
MYWSVDMSEIQFAQTVTAQEAWEIEMERQFDEGELDGEYAEYIVENSGGDRIICNGHTLTAAMEDGYLADKFMDYVKGKK